MSIRYIYTVDQFLNNKVDISKLDKEIRLSDITIALDYVDYEEPECGCWFKASLLETDYATLSGVVSQHDGVPDNIDDVQYVEIRGTSNPLPVDLFDEFRDASGKLRVHQTSRNNGTMICWTGEGDDTSDPTLVGGGTPLSFAYKIGQTDPLVRYIDFNLVENKTYLHEGYISWQSAELDWIDLQLVSRVTGTVAATGTTFNLYAGYLIIPAYPGTGTIQLTTDITQIDGGLVYMPLNDQGLRGPSFWNATWDKAIQRYTNITPAPTGNGQYNMFDQEVVLAHFVRHMHLLGDGFIALNSSDTDELGSGMRLKLTADTNKETTVDHDWAFACLLCLHRQKSVSAVRML